MMPNRAIATAAVVVITFHQIPMVAEGGSVEIVRLGITGNSENAMQTIFNYFD